MRKLRWAWWAPVGLVCAVSVAVVAACTGGGDSSVSELPTVDVLDMTATPTNTPLPTATREPTATATPLPTATPTPSAEGIALAMWEEYWTIAVAPDGEEPEATRIGPQAVSDAMRRLENTIGEPFQVDLHTNVVQIDAGVAQIEDCIIVYDDDDLELKPLVGQTANYVTAFIDVTGEREPQIVTSFDGSCIPAEIADEVIAHYEEFWDAVEVFWNPADPDHPLVEESMTGDHLEKITDRLTEFQAEGIRLENARPITRPEVMRFDNSRQVTIIDCQNPNPRQIFLDAQGERLPFDDAPNPDQRDWFQASMVRQDGRWKVAATGADENAECDLAPSDNGLLVAP